MTNSKRLNVARQNSIGTVLFTHEYEHIDNRATSSKIQVVNMCKSKREGEYELVVVLSREWSTRVHGERYSATFSIEKPVKLCSNQRYFAIFFFLDDHS